MNKLANKIKEIRLKEGLSQEAFAKELGYNSKSTINKIEKGINEISYEKLMLLVKKYDLALDELFDNKSGITYETNKNDNNIYISFSARNNGNCYDIASYMMEENDKIINFKDIFYNPCSRCNYECFNSFCKFRHDDIYNLLESSMCYKNIIFIVPMYCGNPSSLFFILNERMQDYFSHNEDKWDMFINKLHFICVYGSDEETPYFIECFKSLINEDRILKIERHKYDIKMNDKVINNENIIKMLDSFKITI